MSKTVCVWQSSDKFLSKMFCVKVVCDKAACNGAMRETLSREGGEWTTAPVTKLCATGVLSRNDFFEECDKKKV